MALRMRLDKLLCFQGLGSRSQAQAMIRKGRVTVDGVVCLDPGQNLDPQVQRVCCDGQALDFRRYRTVMMHKPLGLVTAARDPKLPTVMDLLPPLYPASEVMPVGRLDRDTSGLLLLTNDGQLAHALLSPKRHVPKTYLAQVDGPLSQDDVAAFAQGLVLSDFVALPAQLALLSPTLAQVTLEEGKYHQVRRMFAARERTVLALKRLSLGPLALDPGLSPGEWRELSEDEVTSLWEAVRTQG